MKYRTKPSIVDAFQITVSSRGNLAAWPAWLRDEFKKGFGYGAKVYPANRDIPGGPLAVKGGLGAVVVNTNDYIVLDGNGNFSVVNGTAFESNFEAVPEEPPAPVQQPAPPAPVEEPPPPTVPPATGDISAN